MTIVDISMGVIRVSKGRCGASSGAGSVGRAGSMQGDLPTVVIVRTQSPECPAFPECARPPTVTEVKAWLYLQEQMLSRIERLLKNCILGENDSGLCGQNSPSRSIHLGRGHKAHSASWVPMKMQFFPTGRLSDAETSPTPLLPFLNLACVSPVPAREVLT